MSRIAVATWDTVRRSRQASKAAAAVLLIECTVLVTVSKTAVEPSGNFSMSRFSLIRQTSSLPRNHMWLLYLTHNLVRNTIFQSKHVMSRTCECNSRRLNVKRTRITWEKPAAKVVLDGFGSIGYQA